MSVEIRTYKCGPPIRAKGRTQALPGRFWRNFSQDYVIDIIDINDLLNLFSGDLEGPEYGLPVDADPTSLAELNYDCLHLPEEWADKFGVVFADPPYNPGFGTEWPKDYPKPTHVLKEMARITRPGGILAMLHILIMPPPKGCKRAAIHPVLCGPYNAIRVLNVYQKLPS